MIKPEAYHIRLSQVKSNLTKTDVYPMNTSDDVIINDSGSTLREYVPTIDVYQNNVVMASSPLSAVDNGTMSITDGAYNKLLS